MKASQAVILAGGRGSRLRPWTDQQSKVMIPFHDQPFLEYLIQMLVSQGFKRVLLLLGYQAQSIQDYFGDGSRWGIEIDYDVSDIENQTGQRMCLARPKMDSTFIYLYGDTYWEMNYQQMWKAFEASGKLASMTVYNNHDEIWPGNICLDQESNVTIYDKSCRAAGLQGVDIGFMTCKREVLDLIPDGNVSFEECVFPKLAKMKQLHGFLTHQRSHTISTPQCLPEMEEYLKQYILNNKKIKVLVTGNLGYIGTVLTPILQEAGYHVTGLDTDYYAGTELYDLIAPNHQIKKDIRDLELEDVKGYEMVIHLAALSNDPLGELKKGVTEEINGDAGIRCAQLSKEAGVKRFIFVSSQSMYGVADVSKEVEEDDSKKNPQTAYAVTKWVAEQAIRKMHADDFVVAALRPSTVFGASPRLRCDIVFNSLIACAYTTGKIEIKSDGTPWRPVIHVRDVSQAVLAVMKAPSEIVNNQAFNVGLPNGNYTVKQLAQSAQQAIPNSQLVFTGEHNSDQRTYRVSFEKIFDKLGDYYKPEWDLDRGAQQMTAMFKKINFTEQDFRGSSCNRLPRINELLRDNKLGSDFKWNQKSKLQCQ